MSALCSRTPGMPELRITRRRLPHWQAEGSIYFITFRLARGVLTADERRLVLDHIKSGNAQFYHLIAVVVMSDHVHALMTLSWGMELSRVVKGIKGVSARLLNQMRGTRGAVWQDEWWDRIVRSSERS